MTLAYANLTIPPAAALAAAAKPRALATAGRRTMVPLTYGEDRVAAVILNVLQAALDPNTLLVQCLWGHACHQVDELRLNDLALPAGSTVTTYTGAQTTVDATLAAAFLAQGITYADTLEGYAFSVVSMPMSAVDGALGFSARVLGRRLYDPRKDSTAGGSGPHRLANPATWEWSDNPSLALADWASNTLYGAGEPVVWASVGPAAAANDAMIGSPAEKHRLIGWTMTAPASIPALAETLRAYAGCWLVDTVDGLSLLPDADAAPVASYSHASGQIAAIEPLAKADLGNSPTVVDVVYTDTSQIPWREATATAELTGAGTTLPLRVSSVPMPGIHRHSQAYREAVERLNKLHLNDLATSVDVFDEGIAHTPGDIIELTHPLGLAAKPMRVTGVQMTSHGRWRLQVAEHDPAAYSTVVVTAPTYPDTALELRGSDEVVRSLIDATWWRPGAAWEWNLNETPAGENSIVWGTGPKGQPQALWRAVAAGTPSADKDGGWDIGTLATTPRQAFVVDPARTYRFAAAIRRTVGTAAAFWGPAPVVCALNTATPAANPYFASWAQPADGRWYLYVGYVYPAGSTGLTNAGAGIYDMETGELVQAGTNYCWPADVTECSTRAYQYYATTGATQYFAPPVVEVMDGYEAGRITYIGEAQVDTINVAQAAITEGTTLLSATTTGSTGSPGASVTVILMAGPTLDVGDDELDFDVSGVADVQFWSQAAIGRVEVFLKWQAGFGNPYTEIGTRRKFATPVDVYTNNTKVSMDKTEAAFIPGPGSKDYFLECRITWIDAAGSTKQCGKGFTADALFKWVRRKR